MKSRKLFIVVLVVLMAGMLALTGCEKKASKSYTFNVDTGDKIEIKMDTTDGYNLTSELPIEFSKDDDIISQGTFGKEEAYDLYYEEAKNSGATIIEEKSNDNIKYFFYKYNNEYNYIIKIKNSKTCFILGNNISQKSAQKIFEKLTFKVE